MDSEDAKKLLLELTTFKPDEIQDYHAEFQDSPEYGQILVGRIQTKEAKKYEFKFAQTKQGAWGLIYIKFPDPQISITNRLCLLEAEIERFQEQAIRRAVRYMGKAALAEHRSLNQ